MNKILTTNFGFIPAWWIFQQIFIRKNKFEMVVCKIPVICSHLNELVCPSGTTVCKVAPINTILTHAWHTGQQSIIQWEMTCFINPYMKNLIHQVHYTHGDLILWSTEI